MSPTSLLWIFCFVFSFGSLFVSSQVNHGSFVQVQDTTTGTTIEDTLPLLPELKVFYDPPNGTDSPTALGIYAWTRYSTALIYYDVTGASPTLNSSFVSQESPYFAVATPFKGKRGRLVSMIAVYTDLQGATYRSKLYKLNYNVESRSRPNSYAFLVPGVESGGYFIRITLEEDAAARPQSSTTQEFADFFAKLGIGTYSSQISPLKLTDIDSDLTGFEGGFPYNVSGKHYGLLIPYHNGDKFFGKVVRIDLKDGMANVTKCIDSYVIESYDASTGLSTFEGPGDPSSNDTCVYVMDLKSRYPQAVGFRRGFLSYPYGYLSPGEYSTVVRIDLENFGLNHTRFINLGSLNSHFGGYSGGFADGSWACFNPFRTYVGRVGGIRSNLPVDSNSLTPYYNSIMVCVNETLWNMPTTMSVESRMAAVRTMDFSIIRPDFRGFADALRVGRHAYLCPMNIAETTYSPYLIRISLGVYDIGTALDTANTTYGGIRSMVNTLNLSMVDTNLKGFSGLFTAGKYLFLVPYRNGYEPRNGQRGHGHAVRLDMNDFSMSGISHFDLTTTTRNQIPSFADTQLRGYSFGFASGLYAFLVPFFNADFHGKIARFEGTGTDMSADLQELCLTYDRKRPNVYKGYRGGFASLWQGVDS